MKKIILIAFVSALLLMLTVVCSSEVLAWSNGGYSDDPSNPDYGTHDWIAEHALDWLPEEEKRYIVDNLAAYLYGTELPDNGVAPDGIGDTKKHHIYYWFNGSLQDDASAVRASEEYNNTLNFLRLGDLAKASKTAGIMSHYIVDVAVFGHVMGAGTDWGGEEHHSAYETYVNRRTSSYDAEFNVYLSFDGKLDLVSAYDAAKELAFDTTFDVDGDLTCVWMDQNYNWSDPVFKNRCGESLNLAVNYLTDVLHTLYSEAASVHNIDTGLDYLAIQEAINVPETLDGYTIFVEEGIYYEHVVVNKTVSLLGENRSATIIDGNRSGTSVMIWSNNVTVSGFTIRNSSTSYGASGVEIHLCKNCVISNNIITNNQIGGILMVAFNNLITNNIITHNPQGIAVSFTGEGNNTISGNTIASNFYVGISIAYSSNNNIFHNYFLNNTNQTQITAAINTWDNGYPSGGNYWSDYTWVDLLSGPYQNETGSDGIGDISYDIGVNNQDNYPLMGMFLDFNVTYPEETYHVNIISNSTVSNFEFVDIFILSTNPRSVREIHFDVSGKDGTLGFCRICIPTALMNDTYTVFVNGTEVPHTLLACSNSTHSYLYFTYNHSTQEVIIIPEFPTWASMLFMVIVLTVVIAVYKRRLFYCSQNER